MTDERNYRMPAVHRAPRHNELQDESNIEDLDVKLRSTKLKVVRDHIRKDLRWITTFISPPTPQSRAHPGRGRLRHTGELKQHLLHLW